MLNFTHSQVKAEILKRSFYSFAKEAFKVLHNGQELKENWHIEYLCNRLQKEAERIIRGEKRDKHLLINVPPRTLKSELVNVFFSIYLWVLDDSIQFISSSYSASLSVGLSVQARRLILSDWFIELFPDVELSIDEKQKSKFSTPNGGMRYCTSTGGSITGMGGDIIVIDDPQNPQEARSDKERDNANRFFNETLRSRLNDPKTGVFIVIMQRLHEDDLTGMLLELEPDNWEHICLPAELSDKVKPEHLKDYYVDGLLFPERLSKDVLNSFKTGLGVYGYSGQYSQTPSPAEGGMIKREWFNVVREMPAVKFDFFLDTAYTDKQQNDPSALMACAFHNNMLWIKQVKTVRLEFPELIKEIKTFTAFNGYTPQSKIYIEPKASGKSIVQQLKRNTNLNVVEDKPPTQDKISRVNSVAPFIESGRVNVMDGMWLADFLEECVQFPNGSHDDMVDTLVMAIDKYTNRTSNIRAFA